MSDSGTSAARWFRTSWPVDDVRRRGLSFYNEPLWTGPESVTTDDALRSLVSFGSYSYLNLNGHPRINAAAHRAIDECGTGTHGVRLLAGTLALHRELEQHIAAFKRTEAALCFSSGYVANVSAISALMGPRDVVICDRLNHASIVDGCSLSRASFVQFRHNDLDDLRACLEAAHGDRILVIVDAVYSMDGDLCDLPGVLDLCQRFGARLMVDEAHALGVVGRTGTGIEEEFGIPPGTVDIIVGTLSKTVPSVGGYVAGSSALCEFLAFQARGFIYSGALAPPAAAAALEAFRVIRDEPERVRRLQQNAADLAAQLTQRGINFQQSKTAIFPIICGDDMASLTLAKHVRDEGIFVQAIPYPVVPRGGARLRVCVTAGHTNAHLEQLAEALDRGIGRLGIARARD